MQSSVPFFTVMLETFLFRTPPSDRRIYVSLVPIVGGVVLATYTEANFEMTGFVAALIASVITGANSRNPFYHGYSGFSRFIVAFGPLFLFFFFFFFFFFFDVRRLQLQWLVFLRD